MNLPPLRLTVDEAESTLSNLLAGRKVMIDRGGQRQATAAERDPLKMLQGERDEK